MVYGHTYVRKYIATIPTYTYVCMYTLLITACTCMYVCTTPHFFMLYIYVAVYAYTYSFIWINVVTLVCMTVFMVRSLL